MHSTHIDIQYLRQFILWPRQKNREAKRRVSIIAYWIYVQKFRATGCPVILEKGCVIFNQIVPINKNVGIELLYANGSWITVEFISFQISCKIVGPKWTQISNNSFIMSLIWLGYLKPWEELWSVVFIIIGIWVNSRIF